LILPASPWIIKTQDKSTINSFSENGDEHDMAIVYTNFKQKINLNFTGIASFNQFLAMDSCLLWIPLKLILAYFPINLVWIFKKVYGELWFIITWNWRRK